MDFRSYQLFFNLINFAAKICDMIKRPVETVAADDDYEDAYKSTLELCRTNCLNDEKCKAMYYSNGFCFIIYKDNPKTRAYAKSAYFDKVCNHTYSKYCLPHLL